MQNNSGSQKERKVDTSLKLGLPQFHKTHKKPKPQQSVPGKVCKGCDNGQDTPTWRRGPSGPGTLCNACGLKYMREQKKGKDTAPEE
ncbi:unnamed protein product [Rhodiola kirilowii]